MRHAGGNRWHVVGAALLSIVLVVSLDALTNSLDTQKFSWDFRYYIGMAENGFNAPLASPFAYRYVTPFLVHGLTDVLGISVVGGFRAIAYVGAFLQLIGVFLFTRWFTRSDKGAYVALVITAFSLFNVKFLLFDVFRPDHLAYAFILLQSYFALERKFLPLLVSTLVASQIREFNVIPLVAYVFAFWAAPGHALTLEEKRTAIGETVISAVALAAAIGIPRLLLPIAENYQFADLSRDGILRVLLAPLVLSRDANFLYSVIAYGLPLLMIAGVSGARWAVASLGESTRRFALAYSALVLIFSFLGGTDFSRFSTYLLVPQALLIGFLAQRARIAHLVVIALSVFVFNRIWLPFPMSDAGTYLDFYGGFGTRLDWASLWRFLECAAFIGVGQLAGRFWPAAYPATRAAAE